MILGLGWGTVKWRQASGTRFLVACSLLASMVCAAGAQQLDEQNFQTNVNVDILAVAELAFQGGNLLYLAIPPGDSTIPSSGVNFIVTGNADATLIAEPDAFVYVQTEDGPQYLGRAVLNGNPVGYRLELRFPRSGSALPANPTTMKAAFLPGYEEGPTTPPLTVDLSTTGQQRTGVLHMESHHNWTPDGGLPLPGLYVGQVTLTLTASN